MFNFNILLYIIEIFSSEIQEKSLSNLQMEQTRWDGELGNSNLVVPPS